MNTGAAVKFASENQRPAPEGIAGKLLELIETLRAMKLKNDELQQKEKPGSALWHHCETMDDHLFDALRLIGE